MRPLWRRLRPWRFAIAYMALIFVVSSLEVQGPAVRFFPLRDKGIHFVEYAILGWLCAGAAAHSGLNNNLRRTMLAFFVAVLWGISDEVHQAFVPGRSAEVADVIADALGAFTGVGMWHFFSNRTVS